MTIKAYLKDWTNGNQTTLGYSWVDLSSFLDTSAHVQLTDRIDDAFISGKYKLWLGVKDPIPPYTPFMVNGKCMVGKSTVTKYLTQDNLYVHDVDLLEATAFLNCLLLGVKVYSKESKTWENDTKKFVYIVELINTLYPDYTFTIKDSNTSNIATLDYLNEYITTKKTYLFDAKSTLFHALNQICLENNSKIRVTFSESNPSQFFIKLEKVPRETSYTIQAEKIIQNKSDQSAEDYGRYLDTYASNVVDRNTLTHCEFIEPRANDMARTMDNALVMLPTPIEKVEEFGVHQVYTIRFFIGGLNKYWTDADTRFASGGMTYKQVSRMYFMFATERRYIFNELYDNYLAKYFPYVSRNFFYANATSEPYNSTSNLLVFDIPFECNGKFPVTCEEMSEWTLRTPQEQTASLVYTTGSNQISNMNASYKNDIWNKFIGTSRGNFLKQNDETKHTKYVVGGNSTLELYMVQVLSNNDNALRYMYWCDYYSITNPILRDEKEDAEFAPISRSYGNSANFIDFDKIIPNMAISNATLGQIEKTVQLDLSNDTTLPLSGQPTTFEGKTWYISSVVWDYGINTSFATLTLVKEYQKKAESIGVDSQSEFTNNPLRNITERSIMLNGTTTDNISEITSQVWYMKFIFNDMNDELIHNINGSEDTTILYKRCSVQATNDTLLFYTEMLDQMIFDYGLSKENVSNGYVEQFPYLYTDAGAECKKFSVEIGTMSSTTAAFPMNMPTGKAVGKDITFTTKWVWYNVRIDKDAREKLTFSIKIKKTN